MTEFYFAGLSRRFFKLINGVDSLEYYEIIRAFREDRDLTQQQIADVLGIK